MNNDLTLFNRLRPISVGIDSVFDHFEKLFDNDFHNFTSSNYPPYNIVKTGEYTYDVEVALAGYSKNDIEVTYENNTLHIKSKKLESEAVDNNGVIHKGIAKRYFSKSFALSDNIEVKDATLIDGLLKVSMEKIIPESKRSRKIGIL